MKLKLLIITLLIPFLTFAKDSKTELTEIESLLQSKGKTVQMEKYSLPNLATAKTSIRKVVVAKIFAYFYQIEYTADGYHSSSASLSYNDINILLEKLGEFRKCIALDTNKMNNNLDLKHIQRKHVTDDGVEFGYMIQSFTFSKYKRIVWFIDLEKYGSKDIIFSLGAELGANEFELSLIGAKKMIDKLRLI